MKTTNQTINLVNKIFLMSLLLVLGLSSASAQNDWKLSTEKEGIKIYTSILPDSKIKAIKVEADFDATASQVVALVMDVNTAPDWVYHVKSAKLVTIIQKLVYHGLWQTGILWLI
jgi:hypothetical protein